ncbi:MAG: hypothetical protein AAGE94_20175 [Acidobacteriota bacterium]
MSGPLDPTIDTLIADAVLAHLRADEELADVLTGGVEAIEIEALLDEGAISTPMLAVVLVRAGDIDRTIAQHETILALYLVTEHLHTRGEGSPSWWRHRVLDHVTRELLALEAELITQADVPFRYALGTAVQSSPRRLRPRDPAADSPYFAAPLTLTFTTHREYP